MLFPHTHLTVAVNLGPLSQILLFHVNPRFIVHIVTYFNSHNPLCSLTCCILNWQSLFKICCSNFSRHDLPLPRLSPLNFSSCPYIPSLFLSLSSIKIYEFQNPLESGSRLELACIFGMFHCVTFATCLSLLLQLLSKLQDPDNYIFFASLPHLQLHLMHRVPASVKF